MMEYTDEVPKEIVNAMHLLIATKDGCNVTDSDFYVNEEEECLVYHNKLSNRTLRANICGDSVIGAIIDFSRKIILGE